MARTGVLLLVTALLLLSSDFCTAQTVDKVTGNSTPPEQQQTASRKEAKVASTKAAATASRVSQMRDQTDGNPSAETPATAPTAAPASHSAFPGSTNPNVNTPGGSGAAFPGRVEKVPSAPPPTAPRTGLPGGYNYAGNNAAVMAERAAATAGQQPNTVPKESVTTKSTRSAVTKTKKKHQAESAEGAGVAGGVGQVTSSNVPGGAAAAAAQPAASSTTVGSASVISSGPQTAAQVTQPAQAAQPVQAAQPIQAGQFVQAQPASAAVTTAGATAVGSASVIQPPKNLEATTTAQDGTFYTGDGRIVQKSSQGAAAATNGAVGTEAAGATNTRSNSRVGSIDVDNTSRSALGQTSKAVASAPGASAGRRHLAQADIGAAAQQLLSNFANGGAQANQGSASQSAGIAAQPLVNTVQTNNNMQSSAAAAADPSSGVVSGKTYQSSSQASPLTPYNQAMENSIGNVAQQMFSSFGKQGTSLQQTNGASTATSDIPAANQFVQPQLPAGRDIVSFNVPHPDLTAPLASAASALAGRKLQDAAGMISPPQPIQEAAPVDISQSESTPLAALKHLADSITEPTGPTALRSMQPMAANSGNIATSGNGASFGNAATSGNTANAATSGNTADFGNAASFGNAATSGNAAGSGFSAAAAVPADYSSAYTASATTGQPASEAIYAGASPFAASTGTGSSAGSFGSSASDAGATAGYSTQPMAAAQAMPSDGTNFNAGRGANAEQSLGGLTGMAINLLNGRRLQEVASSTLDNIAATVAKDSAVQAAAVSLVKAASAASGAYWISAPKDTAAAMNVIQLSAADKPTAAAATQLATAVKTAALASFGSSLPTSLSTAASHLDFASLVQDPTVQSAAVPVLQAAAAAAGNSWNADALGLDGAAESTVASAVADPSTVTAARSLAQTIVSQSALTSFGTTLGNFFSGRRLHQADFGTIVNNVATDPAVQAAAVHVMEAANTEVAALHVLSAAGPASAPAPLPATNTLTALQQLVSSVSHNAIATALPFTAQQTTSSSAPVDWEALLAAPANAAAAAAAAQKDAGVVKKFDAVETGRAAAAQLQGAVAGLLSGAGGRRLAAAGDGQVPARSLHMP